ncbi:hypothetical protein [Ruminococcus flavefaciens]|uniref:hypothetical protein n=1 Tax=Ruminococcus flavefaciens TaxID=1265 RepID=UPI0011B24D15|nr:hypothetical protein [Ruminococcus flavefaciens]
MLCIAAVPTRPLTTLTLVNSLTVNSNVSRTSLTARKYAADSMLCIAAVPTADHVDARKLAYY